MLVCTSGKACTQDSDCHNSFHHLSQNVCTENAALDAIRQCLVRLSFSYGLSSSASALESTDRIFSLFGSGRRYSSYKASTSGTCSGMKTHN